MNIYQDRSDVVYSEFENWLDELLENGLPNDAVAVNFNIYEEEDNYWSVQLIASDRFDDMDDEWACFEVYSSQEDLYYWESDCDSREVFEEVCGFIERYLEEGNFAEMLKSYRAIGAGFVDGELGIIFMRNDDE